MSTALPLPMDSDAIAAQLVHLLVKRELFWRQKQRNAAGVMENQQLWSDICVLNAQIQRRRAQREAQLIAVRLAHVSLAREHLQRQLHRASSQAERAKCTRILHAHDAELHKLRLNCSASVAALTPVAEAALVVYALDGPRAEGVAKAFRVSLTAIKHLLFSRSHQPHHRKLMEAWTENRYWALASLSSLGYVYQEGHDGAPCANPTMETMTMKMSTRFGETEIVCRGFDQRCFDEEERQVRRRATYHKYRKAHLDDRREKTRLRMAALRARESHLQKQEREARHREAQRKYREKYREQIAHRARRAAVRKNKAAGKAMKLRPKARQYWSDPELMTDDEEEEEDD
ncbi:hypothetical protein C8F04DRAFT_1252285 [Mycena alexandri]|uniref:Uncharacterized protein n=1 Tax=Mycena alexandri TaxID=1745969 RepID=A0AAD6TA84_9AGAR|nr:hypothetical protein C8F04DRAFT_1252285 [Mycena alexandri]